MREQWLRIGILLGALFAINAVGRLVIRIGSIEDISTQQTWTLLTYCAIALVLAVLAGWWGHQRQLARVSGELAAATVAAGVLILFVGPFISGTTPAAIGVGDSFNAAWQYLLFAAGGALVGLLTVIMLGRDYTSRQLKRFAEARQTKPHRPVRVRR